MGTTQAYPHFLFPLWLSSWPTISWISWAKVQPFELNQNYLKKPGLCSLK